MENSTKTYFFYVRESEDIVECISCFENKVINHFRSSERNARRLEDAAMENHAILDKDALFMFFYQLCVIIVSNNATLVTPDLLCKC